MLIAAAPDGRLTFPRALACRRKGSAGGGIPADVTGNLMTDGCTGCRRLLARIAGIQQCSQHIIRRCRQVSRPGPGNRQHRAQDIITILRDARAAAEDARARGSTGLARQVPDGLLKRCGTAAESGRTRSRLRARDKGNHPGCALARRLEQYREQVFLVTRDFAVDQTSNISGRGAKKARRRQAVTGYWHTLLTPGRWCRIASYPGSAAARGTGAPGAVSRRHRGKALATAAAGHQLKPGPGTP